MMIAAIYARKSTEQHGVSDDEKSITRQIENARTFAAAKGWTVSDAHIFADDAVSGAEVGKLVNRRRLLEAIRSGQKPFQALIMRDTSRFSRRDGDEAFGELKAIAQAGIQVWFYQDGNQFAFGTLATNVVGYLGAEFAAEYRRQIARWTTEGMERLAREGKVTGGRVFGYKNVPEEASGRKVRVIVDVEADVVREIFERCSRGQGFRTIAHELNAQQAPSPRAQLGRSNGWCPSSVREALHRPLYRGEIVYNRTKKRNALGEKKQHRRPQTDRIVVAAPQLRIVPETLWTAAHERLGASRETYLRGKNGTLYGKPANGIESKYLLTGLMQCATCGGGLYVASRQHGRQRKYFYGCTTFHQKGASVCRNNTQIAMDEADWAVMEAVQDEILDPAVVAFALETAVAALTVAPAPGAPDRLSALSARESELERQIQNLTAAIAAGGEIESLVGAVKERDRDRRRVQAERLQIEALQQAGPMNAGQLRADLAERVAEWRTMAARTVAQGRQVLRKLLRGRVLATPGENGLVTLSGQADYGKLFSGILIGGSLATAGTSPAGTERCGNGPAFRRMVRAA